MGVENAEEIGSSSKVVYPDSFDSPISACLVIGVALTAIASVGSYYALVNGLELLDTAETSLEIFESAFLIEVGLTLTIVGAGNGLYLCYKLFFEKNPHYTHREAVRQVGLSVMAPIAAVPFAVALAAAVVIDSKSQSSDGAITRILIHSLILYIDYKIEMKRVDELRR